MRSLRAKFTLTLLLTSFSAIVLVGVIAQHLVLVRFDQMARERAFGHFRADVRGFITQYGSWRQGQAAEGFTHYVLRHRRPPRPPRLRGALGPPGPPPGRFRDMPPGRPRIGLHRRLRPPFRFVLLAPDGVVVQGASTYRPGSTLPARLRARQMPITIGGHVRAYAVPLGSPVLSNLDRTYLAAINKALLYALASASVVALIVGVFFGNSLSRSLRALTSAVAAMHAGNLRQEVDIHTEDEIGVLASNFNAMSEKLAQAHEQLHHSNATITKQAARLKELSIRDELTGMFNRRHFNERMKQVLARANRYGHPVSIAIADLDDFKKINDGFSHAVGDRVLSTVGSLIRENIRDVDIPARFGGEEFVIAFPETAAEQAAALCERLRRKIEQFHWSDIADHLTVTISMGLDSAFHPETGDQVLGAADKKLYAAKNGGKNRLVV